PSAPAVDAGARDELRDKWKIVDGDCREGANGLITYHVDAFDDGVACGSRGMTVADNVLLHATKMHMAGTNMSEVPLFEAWVTPRNFRSISRDAARLGWMAR